MADFIIKSESNSYTVEIDGKKADFLAGDVIPYTPDGGGSKVYMYDIKGIFKAVVKPSIMSKDRIPIEIGVDNIDVDGVTVFADADALLAALRAVFFFNLDSFASSQLKVTYYEIIDISAATSGTLQDTPATATIQEDEFGDSGHSVLSTLNSASKPSFITPFDSVGGAITINVDTDGAWVASDTFVDPVAVLYVFIISGSRWDGVDLTKVVDFNQANAVHTMVDFVPQGESPSYLEGRTYYNAARKTLDFYTNIPDVTINMPEETPVRIFNDTGVIIANGQVCRIIGSSGGLPTVTLSQADTVANASKIGVATHAIANNSEGLLTIVGSVGGLDTSMWLPGAILYVSAATAGALTDQQQPILSPSARVLVSDAVEGTIFVFPSAILDITALAQTRGSTHTQSLTTTPAKCYAFDLSEFEINVDIDQNQNPGVGDGYDAEFSPTSAGASGLYEFKGQITFAATGNEIHVFEIYVNGLPTGIFSTADLRNNNVDAATVPFVGTTEAVLSASDNLSLYVYVLSGTSGVTYEASLLGVNRMRNV